ncbi:hypothetical protein H8S90_19730 [Olivibacter sp. SDN3]|uniref:hypothetical protein n=1 Tax=Olivibacter sp. SDN3 TaxID=2764720 RepID=UPI0016516B20|nr:hypothetical protein [Olivibacter sp. SDN3]QNL48961.1 hypothetical protein H8S90_19730 [Olivibacter sp. SDN3]
MRRICIYPKDIARITGKSYRQSLRIHHTIKKANNKQPHQVVTLEELCVYLGLERETVIKII